MPEARRDSPPAFSFIDAGGHRAVARYCFIPLAGVPKLFVNVEPAALITGPLREQVQAWPNLTEVEVPGIQFVQEDSADAIGCAVAAWHSAL